MPLTDTAVRQARPRERVYRLSDGRGLVLLIQPNGSKWWRFRYRWQGVEQMLSMGTYPDTPLLEARTQRDLARQQLAKGIDPGAARRKAKDPVDRSFRGVAQHWLVGLEKLVRAGKRSGKVTELASDIASEISRSIFVDFLKHRRSSITRQSRTRLALLPYSAQSKTTKESNSPDSL